jgi:hypothetical protein
VERKSENYVRNDPQARFATSETLALCEIEPPDEVALDRRVKVWGLPPGPQWPTEFGSTASARIRRKVRSRALFRSGPQAKIYWWTPSTARNENALECIYKSLLRTVISGGVIHDESDVEDVLLDVLLQVWNQGSRYNPNEKGLRGLLITLARRRSLDCLRQKAAYRHTAIKKYRQIVDLNLAGRGRCLVCQRIVGFHFKYGDT